MTLAQLIEQNGFMPTVRGWAPGAHKRIMEEVSQRGALKGAEAFPDPHAGNFEDRAADRESAISGAFFYGPLGDGTFVRVWFYAAGMWRPNQEINWDIHNVDPRTCHYSEGCDHDWDDEIGCDNCEADTDLCTVHNTYH